MPKDLPERIYLLPEFGDDEGTVWCADPAPGTGMDPADAVAYVRADVHDRRVTELLEANSREVERRRKAEADLAGLTAQINTPIVDDWFAGVRNEAPHQQQRWGAAHDAGKSPLDWFWLIGYLAQKAAFSAIAGDHDKAKHHTISTGAALLNWWRQIDGLKGGMRPGIEPPIGVADPVNEEAR